MIINVNRKKLGSIIFRDRLMRKKLNKIVHPYVFEGIKKLIEKYKEERIIFLGCTFINRRNG